MAEAESDSNENEQNAAAFQETQAVKGLERFKLKIQD